MSIYRDIEIEFIERFKSENQLIEKEDVQEKDNQVDFVYEQGDKNIMVEVYATTGKALSAKKRKLVSDAFKMLYLEKKEDKTFDKYIITVDEEEWKKSLDNTWQFKALKSLNINLLFYTITDDQKENLKRSSKENVRLQLINKE